MSRLIVKGLPSQIKEEKVRELFEQFGTVTDLSLKHSKDGIFRRFGFVGFEDEAIAKKAIAKLNNTIINSSKLIVEECKPFAHDSKPAVLSKYFKGKRQRKENLDEIFSTNKKPKIESKNNNNINQETTGEEKIRRYLKKFQIVPAENNKEIDKIETFLKEYKGIPKLTLLFHGLPNGLKQKNFSEWIKPIHTKSIHLLRTDLETFILVEFNRPADLRKALERNNQFLGGNKIKINTLPETTMETEIDDPEKVEEIQKIEEEILETGRLFIRNLPYICNEDHLKEIFEKFGELAELQVIIDKRTGKCKGFALVMFIFPEHALQAYKALDGTIFKGRMLHILAGESKPEPKLQSQAHALSEYQRNKVQNLKENAGQVHVWNPLYMGGNAAAETLAEKLQLDKYDLVAEKGQNSAGVRLAMAETRLVKETRDFLIKHDILVNDDVADKEKPQQQKQRSDRKMIAKNLRPGTDEETLRKMFAKFGDLKKIAIAPGGLSAMIEFGNKVDAKKAFNNMAYSQSRDRAQPMYLEWATTTLDIPPINSNNSNINKMEESEKVDDDELDEEQKPKKILVRNVPFQASLDELQQLFTAFGEIRDIRLPKKMSKDGTGHRGFCFVDFISNSDAKRAMEALSASTHLYGRRLVLEWAKQDESIADLRQKLRSKFSNKKVSRKTKKELQQAVNNVVSDDEN